MTDKINSAIQILVNATYSDEWQGNEELTKAQHLAINSLKAWEEVLNELEILIRGCNIMLEDNNEDMFYGGKKRAYEKAIEIINQKMAEIEEVR